MLRLLVRAPACFAILIVVSGAPGRARQHFNVDEIGPAVGQPAPDFTAVDQNGRSQTLRSVLGPRGAVLVFFRSADW